MEITELDICKIQAMTQPLLGKKAWGISLGVGSFVTIEFGSPVQSDRKGSKLHGEWHLWIYCCVWRLEEGSEILATSETAREKLEIIIQRLEGLTLQSVELHQPLWDTIFIFEHKVILRSFSLFLEESEDWMLYVPNGNVLSLGPGLNWSYESSKI